MKIALSLVPSTLLVGMILGHYGELQEPKPYIMGCGMLYTAILISYGVWIMGYWAGKSNKP